MFLGLMVFWAFLLTTYPAILPDVLPARLLIQPQCQHIVSQIAKAKGWLSKKDKQIASTAPFFITANKTKRYRPAIYFFPKKE